MKNSILFARCINSILLAILCIKLNETPKPHGAARALDKKYKASTSAIC
jgi:hypothetical protein